MPSAINTRTTIPINTKKTSTTTSTPSKSTTAKMEPNGTNVRPPTLATAPRLPSQSTTTTTRPSPLSPPTASANSSEKRNNSSRRLTLSNILGKGKRTNSDASSITTATTSAAPTPNAASRSSLDLLRNSSPISSSSCPSSDPRPEASTTGSSKPPVTLPKIFRRRRSSSIERSSNGIPASTITRSRRGSGSSDGSPSPPSSVTEFTGRNRRSYQSPVATEDGGERTGVNAWLSNNRDVPNQGDRRRSRIGIAASPRIGEDDASSGSGHSEEEEDISDFVRASAHLSSSPSSTASPFSTRIRATSSSSRDIDSSHSLPVPRASPPVDGSASPTLPSGLSARRLPAGLHLSDLPTNSNATRSSESIPIHASVTSSSGGPEAASTSDDLPSTTSPVVTTQTRLRALPRLLSSDAYNFVSAQRAADAEAQEESESDLDTDGDSDTEEASPDVSSPVIPGGRAPVMSVERATMPRLASVSRLNGSIAASASASAAASEQPTAVSTNTWVTFDPVTPTPGPLRTARIASYENQQPDSYFDIPRRKQAGAATPGGSSNLPPMTPLLPMSISSAARGRRPTRQDEAPASPALNQTATPTANDGAQPSVRREPSANAITPSIETVFRRRSFSAVDLLSPVAHDEQNGDEPIGTAALTELDPIWQIGSGLATPGPSFLSSPALKSPYNSPRPTSPSPSRLGTPAERSKLQRRASMFELPTEPPMYHAQYNRAGLPPQIVYPREEEGKEGLPDYSCAIHLEGYMPMKKEFSAPSVQARDRAWKRVYVVLHGTSIKIYKYDLRTHPIPGEEDWSALSAQVAAQEGPPPLHFHPGEYGGDVIPTTASSKFSITDARTKAKHRIVQAATSSDQNALLRQYSLQHAESGLAADYVKRKHVVRVRAEGEQFLLQTNGDRGTIDLIEVLQAATNVALDLDARVLPKFITLPRRRRRRRRVVDPNAPARTATNSAGAVVTADSDSRQNTTGSRSDPVDRLGDMLEEEQSAYAAASGGGSTV